MQEAVNYFDACQAPNGPQEDCLSEAGRAEHDCINRDKSDSRE